MVGTRFRALALALLVGLFGLPGPAAARPDARVDDASRVESRSLHDLIRRDVLRSPHAERILDGLERAKATEVDRAIYSWPIWDVNRDGRKDVLVAAYVFDVVTWDGYMTMQVLEGDTGRMLSRHRHDFGPDDFCMPRPARVGKRAVKGMFIFCRRGFLGFTSTTEISWQVIALNTRGRRAWSRRITAGGATVAGQAVVRDAPITMWDFNGAPGRATDVLVGLFDGAIVFDESINTTRVAVVDGRNGSLVEHPRRYVGVNSVSYPKGVSDYSGDGLDDYGVISVEPKVEQEPAEGAPVDIAGFVRMQRGKDGADIWRSAPFYPPSPQDAELWSAHDLRGNRRRELIINVTRDEGDGDWQPLDYYLLDGARGLIAARGKNVGFVWSTGDLDRDGDRDLIAEKHLGGQDWLGYRWTGLTSKGRRIYTKKVVERGPHNDQAIYSGWFYIDIGGGPEWDVEPDRIGDNVAWFWFRNEVLDLGDTVNRLVSMKRGRTFARGDEHLQPLRGSVDRRGGDFLRGTYDVPGYSLDVRRGSGRRLWKATLRATEPFTEKTSYTFSVAERFDGDRCADVLAETNGSTGAWLTMLDGGSGRPLWTKTYWAPTGLDVTVGADRNRTC
jgi:hypothetical protein